MTKIQNIGDIVASAWQETLEETEDPFRDSHGILGELLGLPRPTYQEYLDRPIINSFGQEVPRIVTVRNNIRFRLRKPPRSPQLPE